MNEYLVYMAMRLRAESPEDAVAGYVDLQTEKGLRSWTYRVDDADGNVVGFFDGFGNPNENGSHETGPTTTVELPTLSTPIAEIRRVSSETEGSVEEEAPPAPAAP